jgi:hypothetical protein
MVKTVVREPKNGPSKVASALIRRLIGDTGQVVPDLIEVQGADVSIADFNDMIKAFRLQKDALELGGFDSWPCARFSERQEPEEDDDPEWVTRWVPIDMGTDSAPLGDVREIRNGKAAKRVKETAERAGLTTEHRSLKDVWQTFADMVGETIGKRRTAGTDPDDGPPEEPFEVTTNSSGLEVLFSIGPFLSTRTGFGRSTPAQRQLPWGSYCFGAPLGLGLINVRWLSH